MDLHPVNRGRAIGEGLTMPSAKGDPVFRCRGFDRTRCGGPDARLRGLDGGGLWRGGFVTWYASRMTNSVSIVQDLVRCPSVTPADAGALGVLERLLGGAGFDLHRITFSEPGAADIDNLYARIGSEAPHLVFAGHTDVVPPGDEAAWTLAPFSGEVKDGILYGRGTVDMKGGIACSVAAVLDYLAANGGKPPKGSISFLITGDEEDIAVNGTIKLLQWAADRGERFDHCILGEPSNVEELGDCIKVGRRGSLSGTLIVDGTQGHVAYPHRAANPLPDISALITAIDAEPLDSGNALFQPSNLEFVSIDVGNKAWNVIPAQARARFNIRYNDQHTEDSLKELVEARAAKAAGNRIRQRIDWEASNANAFITKPGPFTELVVDAIHEVTGRKPDLNTGGGTSDARFISHYCPVLEFGLVGQTMHQVDERVAVTDLERLTMIYHGVLDRYFA
jgi:succinyl-diaminopimelate desuccinylase